MIEASRDVRRAGVARLQQAEHDPRLAADLGEDPAGPVGEDRQEDAERARAGGTSASRSSLRRRMRATGPASAISSISMPAPIISAEGPVRDADDRDVVARAVLRLLEPVDLVDAGQRAVPAEGRDAATPGAGCGCPCSWPGWRVKRTDGEDRQAGALGRVVERLGGRHLHRLLVLHQPGLAVAEADRRQDRDERERQREPQRAREDRRCAGAAGSSRRWRSRASRRW